jgi:hypothetical protein
MFLQAGDFDRNMAVNVDDMANVTKVDRWCKVIQDRKKCKEICRKGAKYQPMTRYMFSIGKIVILKLMFKCPFDKKIGLQGTPHNCMRHNFQIIGQ